MSEDTILCHQCGKDLVMKFIELKDLVFCSSTCFENFKNKMSRKDFFKNYGEAFKPDEQKWVPKYSNYYIKMCGYCPPKLAEACRAELDISAPRNRPAVGQHCLPVWMHPLAAGWLGYAIPGQDRTARIHPTAISG